MMSLSRESDQCRSLGRLRVNAPKSWDLVVLLKGAHSLLIAAPDGRIGVLPFKTDALSTAGAGDMF